MTWLANFQKIKSTCPPASRHRHWDLCRRPPGHTFAPLVCRGLARDESMQIREEPSTRLPQRGLVRHVNLGDPQVETGRETMT